jgi:hypothetical protein
MNIIEDLLQEIETKNSCGKNELVALICKLLAKHYGGKVTL